jgi:hypothetical protein
MALGQKHVPTLVCVPRAVFLGNMANTLEVEGLVAN